MTRDTAASSGQCVLKSGFIAAVVSFFALGMLPVSSLRSAAADDSLERRASWDLYDAAAMSQMLRKSLDEFGVAPDDMDHVSEQFLAALEQNDADPLDAYVQSVRPVLSAVSNLISVADQGIIQAAALIDPNQPGYADIEALPKSMRASLRTWLGRQLVRQRLYDEALPVIAEVEAAESIDPAATLFYRGACYHALLMKKEALTDLRRLLENEDKCPVRFSRTAKMMVADIKPLKEDSLDEISRLMTDVTRRLDLGRASDDVQDQEQKIIDKLTKLIEKIEEQQQQQQQQQQAGGGGQGSPKNGKSSPMQDSQIGGASGNGDVDRKNLEDRDGWGNLPPAERQQALQQISRDLPTHYREAIEAYFRKLATDNK
ncbi:hypothetical protein [Stieleria marina]|uniref:Tetratricopeptide repeat protein n=1 Tax=Stieleria marina TaxID=1930275 RepID=A0A517P0T7_9BACT|nr:hypothetical protein K239x_50020 [Planctomycetes bacterium K23_9]